MHIGTRRALLAAVSLTLSTSLVLVPTETNAAQGVDSKGPEISVSGSPNILNGQNFDDPLAIWDGLYFLDGGGTFEYRWSASDPSGICRHSVDLEDMVDQWTYDAENRQTNSQNGQYAWYEDGYFNSDDVYMIHINVWDCVGNKSTVARRHARPGMVADYGEVVPKGWGRTQCVCAMGDSTLRTTKKNASLTTTVNAKGVRKHVGLIMAKGPARGKAAIYFDNKFVKKIDTYAPENSNRVVMWDVEISGTKDHQIKVVNLATPGRKRIDIDAYIQN